MAKPLDTRQSANRSFLRKLANIANFDANAFSRLDHLMAAVNSEVSPAFEMYINDPANRVLNIASNTVSNPETSIRHSNSPINKQFPIFTSGTVTLPAASGSPIVVSPTITPNPTLTITANAYIKALVECDTLGNLSVTLGQEGASEALATFPGINTKAFQIGILVIRTIAGVVQNVTGGSLIQFQGGGGSGAAGSGTGVKEPIPGYQWLEEDTFDVLKTSVDSKVTSTNYTNAVQNLGKDLYKISCDKSKTVNVSSGTSLTITGGAPSFTVQVGDIAYATSGPRSGQWRRIATVNSQTDYVLDAAFSGGNASNGDTLMISQAVWTLDLVNLGSPTEKTRARDQFSGNITQIAVDYFDSLAADDDVPDFVDTARVVVSASNDGLVSDVGVPTSDKFSAPFVRQPYPAQINDYILGTAVNSARLFLAFFCNPNNGSVTSFANLLAYEANFEVENFVENGGTLDSAYCYTDATGVPVNCSVSTPAGFTQIQLTWSYVPLVNPGTTAGQLRVYVDGEEIPRYVATSTLDAYYTEVANSVTGIYDTVRLHADFHAVNRSVEIIRSEGIVDTANTNSTRIAVLEEQNNIITVTSDYTISATDYAILCNCTGGNINITLPSAIGRQGKEYLVKKIDTSSNFVTMLTTSAQTLDLEASGSIFIYAAQDDILFKSDGANWRIVNRYLSRQTGTMYLGSNQTISNATFTKVDFTAANDVNDQGICNPSTDQVTIKYTGRYDIVGNLSYQLNGAGTRWLWLYINGIEKWGIIVPSSNDFKPRLSVSSGTVLLNAGDVIEMYTWQNSSGSLILDATNSQSNIITVQRTKNAGN